MPGDAVLLQFTQDDRDMLRDTNRDAKQILDNMANSSELISALALRVAKLEVWQARVMAICGFIGFGAGLVAKAVWK